MNNIEQFIEILKKSSNKILVRNSEDFLQWSKLNHDKNSLEVFLKSNIAEIHYFTNNKQLKKVIACSNGILIKKFNSKSPLRKNISPNIGTKSIISRKKNQVNTWNLIKNDFYTIPLSKNNDNWMIMNWITLPDSEDKIEEINTILHNILTTQKNKKNDFG